MGVIAVPNTFSANTSISSSQVNSNFTTIYNEFNGAIAAANLASDSVTTAKIADLNVTTAKINTAAVTAPKLADGVVVQHVISEISATGTTTTIIPQDDTIPQNTEGGEISTIAITPKSATNLLLVRAGVMSNSSASGASIALFRDTTAGAIGAIGYDGTDLTYMETTARVTAGSTSETTFKVRGGPDSAGTFRWNGAGGRYFGAITKSYIEVWEIKAS